MKLAVIGAGNFGKNHVRTLHALGVLHSVSELKAPLREAVSRQYPAVHVMADYAPLLHDSSIEAVSITTPAPTHHAIARKFLEAGKDVFVEKPMTLTLADAEDLQRTAEKHQRILMVGHLLMYQPAVRFIHDFLKSGKLGKIFTLHQERKKLGKVRAVENAMWSLGVHDVAVLLYLVGERPEGVTSFGHCGLQQNVEDDVYVHLAFPSGVKATIHNCWLWPEDSRMLRVIGEKGMLVYNERENKVTRVDKTVDAELNHHDGGSQVVYEGAADPLKLELQHFLDCVSRRLTPDSDGNHGMEVIRVLEMAAVASKK